MATRENREIWRELMKLYELNPILWKTNSDKFKDSRKKLKESLKAWDLLLNKYKELEPDATLSSVKRKINNLRTCYNRERKKIQMSAKSGVAAEYVYETSLWYYDCLAFLGAQYKEQENAADASEIVTNSSEYENINEKESLCETKDDDDSLQETCEVSQSFASSNGKHEEDLNEYDVSWTFSFPKTNDNSLVGMTSENKDVWRKILKLYQQNPALWKINCDAYRNKRIKFKAWELLLNKYKELEPQATLNTLKAKIYNFKTSYRREWKKVQNSVKSGVKCEHTYVPTLWYYEILAFLGAQYEEQETDADITETAANLTEYESIRVKRSRYEVKDAFPDQTCEALQNTVSTKGKNFAEDAKVYGKSWACSFRKINDNTQQIYAKKAIEDILFLGQLNQLTINSVKMPTNNKPGKNI